VKFFVDTNVVLDVLAQREPWFKDSSRLLAHVEQGRATGHIAAHTLTTLHYLLSKHLGQQRTAAVLIDLTALLQSRTRRSSGPSASVGIGLGGFRGCRAGSNGCPLPG